MPSQEIKPKIPLAHLMNTWKILRRPLRSASTPLWIAPMPRNGWTKWKSNSKLAGFYERRIENDARTCNRHQRRYAGADLYRTGAGGCAESCRRLCGDRSRPQHRGSLPADGGRGCPPAMAEARCQRGCQFSGLHEDFRHGGSDQRLRPGTGSAR